MEKTYRISNIGESQKSIKAVLDEEEAELVEELVRRLNTNKNDYAPSLSFEKQVNRFEDVVSLGEGMESDSDE